MELGRGLTSVRGNRGKKIVRNGPLVRQKKYKVKKKRSCLKKKTGGKKSRGTIFNGDVLLFVSAKI
jgi:hypothetical protein